MIDPANDQIWYFRLNNIILQLVQLIVSIGHVEVTGRKTYISNFAVQNCASREFEKAHFWRSKFKKVVIVTGKDMDFR